MDERDGWVARGGGGGDVWDGGRLDARLKDMEGGRPWGRGRAEGEVARDMEACLV